MSDNLLHTQFKTRWGRNNSLATEEDTKAKKFIESITAFSFEQASATPAVTLQDIVKNPADFVFETKETDMARMDITSLVDNRPAFEVLLQSLCHLDQRKQHKHYIVAYQKLLDTFLSRGAKLDTNDCQITISDNNGVSLDDKGSLACALCGGFGKLPAFSLFTHILSYMAQEDMSKSTEKLALTPAMILSNFLDNKAENISTIHFLRYVLDKGCPVDAQDSNDDTLLMHIAQKMNSAHQEASKNKALAIAFNIILNTYHPNLTLKNKQNQTVLDILNAYPKENDFSIKIVQKALKDLTGNKLLQLANSGRDFS